MRILNILFSQENFTDHLPTRYMIKQLFYGQISTIILEAV